MRGQPLNSISHAVEGFRVNAIDYLLKPVSYEDFLEAAVRAQKIFEATANVVVPVPPAADFLTVKSKGTYLYGTVTGFGQQRVRAAITSILVGGKFLKVNLSVDRKRHV